MPIKRFLKIFCLSFLISSILFNPVHAYAGPGSALGILIVIITILLAFFGSIFLKIINFIKRINSKIQKTIANKKNRKNTK